MASSIPGAPSSPEPAAGGRSLVEQEREGSLLRIWLSREAVRNALSRQLVDALAAAFTAIEADVRLVVLGGRGRDFCAGADLGEMRAAGTASLEENRMEAERLGRLFRTVRDCPVPVIARVHGAALGGGGGLVAACDLAVATETATFGFTEVRLGLLPAVISPYVLRRIGAQRARALFLTGERLDGRRAALLGLVDEAVPEAELDLAIERNVALLRQGSSQAQSKIKELLRVIDGRPLAEAEQLTPAFIAEARASGDGQEGLLAFLEKRPPRWTGEE